MTIERKIQIKTVARGRKRISEVSDKNPKIKLRPNRKKELMAFAIVFDLWLEQGKVSDLSEISEITRLSRFMVSKIMRYRLLETQIQKDFFT